MKPRVAMLALLFFGLSCDTTEVLPPPPPQYTNTIHLTIEDIGVTAVWLKVTFLDTVQARGLRLVRDDQTVASISHSPVDTIILDEALAPSRMYVYKAYRLINATVVDSSDSLPVTTMDTTSHNFTWQIDTLGEGNASGLNDVFIIDENNVLAVGEIYLKDSTGQFDPLPYNLVKWDGQQWELKRVSVMFRGNLITPQLNAIFAFSATDIWLSSGVPIHGDGQNWTQYHLFDMGVLTQTDGSINKIWGTAGSMYFVGNRGTVVHYTSGTWRRVESGTTLDVYDIWGDRNPVTGESEILAIASNVFTNQGKKLLRIQGTAVSALPDSGLMWGVNSIWFSAGKRYYIVGPGIHQKRSLHDPVWSVYPPRHVTWYSSGGVRGSSVNDVFVVGSFREIVHFNGVSWHRYVDLMPGSSGSFGSIAIKGDLMLTVGLVSQYAMVAIGRR